MVSQSDRTRVPPVTAERSPPASRMTGADSPVMADSSTDAIPSMISPSPGMNSPAITLTKKSPRTQFGAGDLFYFSTCDDSIGDGFRSGFAKRFGLGFAAALQP